MINRVYMTKERFEEELKSGNLPHKSYEDYKKSVDKLYDELDTVSDEDLEKELDESK
ncbi:hypothetical protein KO488_02910 [Poseidonibacter lekithochrous]|uniref:hypothetical protein n=1 Tax=Poseidonibacter TaxID=2321187 RepID=UPI001C07F338|nr:MULTISPECIES: hypothetical protein [Poseidonibacter]MBU3013693.1 hypothetical protein [Poseidonibacter lekithochrous]MDO6826990.1 hypothetical protein [Poseidonibacter sp. 1_MG-2023]